MGDDARIPGLAGDFHRGERLGDRPDLVQLDEERIADALLDAFFQNRRVGDEHIVADELHPRSERGRQAAPARPVGFAQSVLDGDNRILPQPVFIERDHLVRRFRAFARLREDVRLRPPIPEFARRDVECEGNVGAGLVTGRLHGFEHELNRLPVRRQVGREPAFVADTGRKTSLLQQAAQRMERLRARAERLGERRPSQRHDHEFLKVDVRVRVGAAVEDVHHRNGQERTGGSRSLGDERREMFVERAARRRRARMRHRHRNAQHRVGAQPAQVRRSVELHEPGVHGSLVGVMAAQDARDFIVHMAHGLEDAFAGEPARVAVAQLERLPGAGGRT